MRYGFYIWIEVHVIVNYDQPVVLLLQSTFKGRLRHFLDVVDPRTLFTSEVIYPPVLTHVLSQYCNTLTSVCTLARTHSLTDYNTSEKYYYSAPTHIQRKLKDCVKLLDDFKNGTLSSGVSNKEVRTIIQVLQGERFSSPPGETQINTSSPLLT